MGLTTVAVNPPVPMVVTPPRVSLWAILFAYLRVGLTAFGMAILQKLKALVVDNHWLSDEEMNEGLALVQLYPGPIMVDFTAYVGYKLRGIPGAIVATTGFILPSFVLMVVLSALYFAAGNLPWVHPLFLGLEALVVGVLFNVTLDLGTRNVRSRTQAVIALLAFIGSLFSASAILLVLLALGIGAWLIRPAGDASKATGAGQQLRSAEPVTLTRWIGIAAVIVVILAVAAFVWALDSDLGAMGLSLFKIGAVAFGNGATIIPLISPRLLTPITG